MDIFSDLFSFLIYILIFGTILLRVFRTAKKKEDTKGTNIKRQSSSMPHVHSTPGMYKTYTQKSHNSGKGAMPHKHETKKYTSQIDTSKLPPGYILLNGEPVRVADLENR